MFDMARATPDVDVEQRQDERSSPNGPRIRCPLCGWTPRKRDLVLHLRAYLEYGRSLLGMPTPVDRNAVSIMPSMVAAFGLVRV
jgi:hypothetical protein